MPTVAGASRSGGTRLQLPNVARRQTVGGTLWALVADATLTYLGTPYTIPGGVYALCDDGGVALDIPAKYYVVYVLTSAPTVLRACRQEQWAATYGANDCISIAYLTDQYDIPMPISARPCIPLAARMQILAGTVASGDAVGDDSTVRFLTLGQLETNPVDGALFAIDAGNHKIKRRDAGTGIWTTLLTDAALLAPNAGGGGTASPGSGIAFAANGDLYYNRSSSTFPAGVIVKVPHGSTSGTAITTSGLTLVSNNNVGGGMAVSADQSTLFVAQPTFFGPQKVYTVNLGSGVVSNYAGIGGIRPNFALGDFAAYYSPTLNASRLTAIFPSPSDVYLDPTGRLYVISGDLGGISRVELDGSVTRLTGTSAYSSSGDLPAFGQTGNGYMGDGDLATIQYFGGAGQPIGSFKNAFSLDVSDCFDLMIADTNDTVVRIIDASGTLYTLAGGPRNNHLGTTIGGHVQGAAITSPILGTGMTVDANAYGLPGNPVALRARPRGQGGGVFVALNGGAHCIVLVF